MGRTGQTVVVSWISKSHRGPYQSVYNWAMQGGPVADSDDLKKAAECLELLKPLRQPEDLPASPSQIVTVRCFDGQNTLEKRFPIDQIPSEIHQILDLMGCQNAPFSRLKSPTAGSRHSFEHLNRG
jgi:hypothetical protein